jgi:hypothetical protein
MASHLLREAVRAVVIGPALWHPESGIHFMVVTGRPDGIHPDIVKPERMTDDICEIRDSLIAAVKARARARDHLPVHVIEDESEMIARCEEIWPGPVTASIRANYQLEKATIMAAMGKR